MNTNFFILDNEAVGHKLAGPANSQLTMCLQEPNFIVS